MIILSIAAQKNAVITFTQTTHDFGTFDESEGKVTTEFEFKNTGNAPLLITRTAASCGCTTPEYPKEPIAPGKSGVIKVTGSLSLAAFVHGQLSEKDAAFHALWKRPWFKVYSTML